MQSPLMMVSPAPWSYMQISCCASTHNVDHGTAVAHGCTGALATPGHGTTKN